MSLAPPSVDVSGAASVLFGLGAYTLVYDNQGCRGGVMRVDERRWPASPQMMESAHLDETDILMGRNEVIVEQAVDFIGRNSPSFVVLMGGPLSACLGTDLDALCGEIRRRSGCCSFAVHTNGFDSYDRGVEKALSALYEQFILPPALGFRGSAASTVGTGADQNDFAGDAGNRARPAENEEKPFSVGILGAVLLDFENVSWLEAVGDVVRFAGGEVRSVLGGMEPDFEALAKAAEVDVNLVVNSAAVSLAQRMERDLGIPYIIGLPMGACESARIGEALKNASCVLRSDGGVGAALSRWDDPAGQAGGFFAAANLPRGKNASRILLVGEQVAMCGVRRLLENEGFPLAIDVGTFFSFEDELARSGDRRFDDECGLRDALGAGSYICVVADPLVGRLLPGDVGLVPLPHAPLSGRRFVTDIPLLPGFHTDVAFVSAVFAASGVSPASCDAKETERCSR